MKSFAAQIDPNISLTADDSTRKHDPASTDSNADIVHALEDINVLSSNVRHSEKANH